MPFRVLSPAIFFGALVCALLLPVLPAAAADDDLTVLPRAAGGVAPEAMMNAYLKRAA